MQKLDNVQIKPLTSSHATVQIGQTMRQITEQARYWKALAERITNPSMTAIGKLVGQSSLGQAQAIVANARVPLPVIAPIMSAYQQSLARINIGRLQSLGALHPEIGDCVAQLGELASAHRMLLESEAEAERALPDFVTPGATRELYLSASILESISAQDNRPERTQPANDRVDIDDETEALKLLRAVAPDLCKAYLGAKHAQGSSSPDKARHMLTSLREVWNHLLRRLAPDTEVLAWIECDLQEKAQDLLHEGKPTRRSRGLYICRAFDSSPLKQFVAADISSLTKLMDLFNRLHEPDPRIDDFELDAVMAKSDSALSFILKLVEYKRRPV